MLPHLEKEEPFECLDFGCAYVFCNGLFDPKLLNVEQDLEADEKRHSHFPWPPLPFLQPADWLSFGKRATKGYSRMAQASIVVAEECQKDGGCFLCAGMDECVVSFGHTFDGSPVILSFCCGRGSCTKRGNGEVRRERHASAHFKREYIVVVSVLPSNVLKYHSLRAFLPSLFSPTFRARSFNQSIFESVDRQKDCRKSLGRLTWLFLLDESLCSSVFCGGLCQAILEVLKLTGSRGMIQRRCHRPGFWVAIRTEERRNEKKERMRGGRGGEGKPQEGRIAQEKEGLRTFSSMALQVSSRGRRKKVSERFGLHIRLDEVHCVLTKEDLVELPRTGKSFRRRKRHGQPNRMSSKQDFCPGMRQS